VITIQRPLTEGPKSIGFPINAPIELETKKENPLIKFQKIVIVWIRT
jgi:hypothetical protein